MTKLPRPEQSTESSGTTGSPATSAASLELVLGGSVRATANVNIALIKYWGKAERSGPWGKNLAAVPSLSLTLADLRTETSVRFAPDARVDSCTLDGTPIDAAGLARVVEVLDRVREVSDVRSRFEVTSVNHVPTAAGLASSASSMAALAAAACRCAGVSEVATIGAIARIGSGSACRSLDAGWVAWDGEVARQVAGPGHWDLEVVVGVISAERKALSSRQAMNRTAATSPFYAGWVRQAASTFDAGMKALAERDFDALGRAMELSTWRMHACAAGADPAIRYLKPATYAAIDAVETLRRNGVQCAYTMDAGPNVKVFCPTEFADSVERRLTAVPGVTHTIRTRPGDAVRVVVDQEERP